MSRTRKGTKPPGWEKWSNRHDKAEQKAEVSMKDDGSTEQEECRGCRLCLCVKCGSYMVVENADLVRCIQCDHSEPRDDNT